MDFTLTQLNLDDVAEGADIWFRSRYARLLFSPSLSLILFGSLFLALTHFVCSLLARCVSVSEQMRIWTSFFCCSAIYSSPKLIFRWLVALCFSFLRCCGARCLPLEFNSAILAQVTFAQRHIIYYC